MSLERCKKHDYHDFIWQVWGYYWSVARLVGSSLWLAASKSCHFDCVLQQVLPSNQSVRLNQSNKRYLSNICRLCPVQMLVVPKSKWRELNSRQIQHGQRLLANNLLPQQNACSLFIGRRRVRPICKLGLNMSKIAGKWTKRYPRFRSEIGDISSNSFSQFAGALRFLCMLRHSAVLSGRRNDAAK